MPSLLIADDSPVKTQLLRSILKKTSWQIPVLVASSTEQAMSLIDEHRDISFAFVDYYIPSENGPAIIGYLKTEHPKCRIALVSSSDNTENRAEAQEKGAEAFICTSWAPDRTEKALLDLIKSWREDARAQ